MYLSNCYDKVYQYIKSARYIVFYLVYCMICSFIFLILSLVDTLFIESYSVLRLMLRFEYGMPLILQLILSYIVYRHNSGNKFARSILLSVFVFTIICATLGLYGYYTVSSVGFDLFLYVAFAQIVFQFILILIMILFIVRSKSINTSVIMKPLIAAAFSIIIVWLVPYSNFGANELVVWGMMITYIVNFFNPILLYIFSGIAKGKLL